MKHRILLVCVLTFFVLSSLPAIPISWETTAEAYKGRYGQTISFEASRDPAPVYSTVSNQTGTTLSVTNECECDIVELYILTPKMEAELDYSKELLQGSVLASGESVSIKLSSWPYLQSFLETEAMDILAVEACDEDGYPLFQYWLPDEDHLEITLSDWDYL